jgi:hypothetical protein
MELHELQRITGIDKPVIYIDDKITGANYIDWFALVPFQGDLKELSITNLDKMLLSLIEYGFFDIKKVWQNEKEGCVNIADGHSTVGVLKHYKPLLDNGSILMLRKSDNQPTTKIPCIFINADSEQELAKKLLLINSEFGEITPDGLETFNSKFGITDLFMNKVQVKAWDIKVKFDAKQQAKWDKPVVQEFPKEESISGGSGDSSFEQSDTIDLVFPLKKEDYDYMLSILKKVRKEQLFEKNSDAILHIAQQFETYVGSL